MKNIKTIIKVYAAIPFVALSLSTQANTTSQYYSAIDVSRDLGKQLHKLISQQRYLSYKQTWRYLDAAHGANAGSVILFYTRRVTPITHKASGANQSNNNFYNREHIWPQSKGLKSTDARRDLHNLVPADRSVNSSRGNKYFAEGGQPHNECKQCNTSPNSWEPPNEVKGDVARIAFYMDLRYDGDDLSGAPDLVLIDKGDSSAPRYFKGLSSLQKWHCQDPVSDRERLANNIAYELQGNRNPFVDYPEWAGQVFLFQCP